MKRAFTMIELIFVIVIIGILAAVAIPKMAATRMDAKVATTANIVTSAANEIASYAVSQGVISNNIPAMSKIAQGLIAKQGASFDSSNGILKIKMHTVSDCIKLAITHDNNDMNLTMSYGNAGSDEACTALQQVVDAANYPIPLKGNTVRF